ncbi:hypothetical protein LTR78_007047 [Recurvomyces mirabilis]|uniref:Uncharacterized protein n=1 Tax=Recurvomyces mirabilis TaxID=574656 RepID=A0AAE1BZ80_9PEZI|nr:hypothetical protein LTR78_007047 [Recurvomyces mirabilis]KAK5153431.1 hypothetical protein LTS14_007600 [Recurvomyces mirabilis]
MSNDQGEADHVSPQKREGRKVYHPRSLSMPRMLCGDSCHSYPNDPQKEYEERKWCNHPKIFLDRRNGTLDSFHQRMVNCTYCDPRRERPELSTQKYLAKMEEEAANGPPLTFTERILASAKRKTKRAITRFLDAHHSLNGTTAPEAGIQPTSGTAPPPKTEQKITHDTLCLDQAEEGRETVGRPSTESRRSRTSFISHIGIPEDAIDWQARGDADRVPSFGTWTKSRESEQ